MKKYLWIENDATIDRVYLDMAKMHGMNEENTDFLFNIDVIDRSELLKQVYQYKHIISASVYTGRSFIQLWRILETTGCHEKKGLSYYSFTGEYLVNALNRDPDFKLPINMRHVIKAVHNNKIIQVEWNSQQLIKFDPATGKFIVKREIKYIAK